MSDLERKQMRKWKYYTPDGVEDLTSDACAQKRAMEQTLRNLFVRHGFREVETPGIEFYDVYAAGAGFVPQEDLFKFFDHQGRILTLRYDGTIPVARMVGTRYRNAEPPLRFFYLENMYRYRDKGGGRQREFTQAGVELIGAETAAADGEVMGLALEAAQSLGLPDFHLSIGQVAFYKGLVEEWKLSPETAHRLPDIIDSKEEAAAISFAHEENLPESARPILCKMVLPTVHDDDLAELQSLVRNSCSLKALTNLRAVLDHLDALGYRDCVSVDLGLLQSLNYYTGTIFKGFSPGFGFPIVSGGRYDHVVGEFGKPMGATGFSLELNLARAAFQRLGVGYEQTTKPILIGYENGGRCEAFKLAASLRAKGMITITDCLSLSAEDLLASVEPGDFAEILFVTDDRQTRCLWKQNDT